MNDHIPQTQPEAVTTKVSLLRGDDIAHRLNISRALAYRLIQRGHIPVVRIGRAVRVRPQDLEEFISRNLYGTDTAD